LWRSIAVDVVSHGVDALPLHRQASYSRDKYLKNPMLCDSHTAQVVPLLLIDKCQNKLFFIIATAAASTVAID
jgi:hypothetical protein